MSFKGHLTPVRCVVSGAIQVPFKAHLNHHSDIVQAWFRGVAATSFRRCSDAVQAQLEALQASVLGSIQEPSQFQVALAIPIHNITVMAPFLEKWWHLPYDATCRNAVDVVVWRHFPVRSSISLNRCRVLTLFIGFFDWELERFRHRLALFPIENAVLRIAPAPFWRRWWRCCQRPLLSFGNALWLSNVKENIRILIETNLMVMWSLWVF